MIDIYSLVPGEKYRVTRDFTDHRNNLVKQGEILAYVERNFSPYHGGHTLVFVDRSIFLQEDENQDLIDRFGEYLLPADEEIETTPNPK